MRDLPGRARPIALLLLAFLLGACAAASAGTRDPGSATSRDSRPRPCVDAGSIATASRTHAADVSGTVGTPNTVRVAVAGHKIAFAGDAPSVFAGRGALPAERTAVKVATVAVAAEPCT